MEKLRPMTEAEYSNFYEGNTERYIQERVRNLGTTVEHERKTVAQQRSQYLSHGLHTPHHYFWVMVDDRNTPLGHLWVNFNEETQQVFIYFIGVVVEQRGKGYGNRLMHLLEEAVKPIGATEIRLNVFGDNAVAQSMYEKQGYTTVYQTMRKPL